MKWQDKLSQRLFNCPYQHIVFTMPHELNSLARKHPGQIYNCLLRSAWTSLRNCCMDSTNLGATPGAVMVLHTFGSDLRYHVHVHALVSFGGLDTNGLWVWPKRKKKIVPFRQIRKVFKNTFLANLSELYHQLQAKISYHDLHSDIYPKAWCVHQQPPTTNSKTISDYLGKYINRIGLSISRFNYDSVHDQVSLAHKDYYRQINKNEPPPLTTKIMHPLVAIHQILQHSLPAYFQKCRYYGLHSNVARTKNCLLIPHTIRHNTMTVRTLMQLICQMIGMETIRCGHCGHDQFMEEKIPADPGWIITCISIPTRNKHPAALPQHTQNHFYASSPRDHALPKIRHSATQTDEKLTLVHV